MRSGQAMVAIELIGISRNVADLFLEIRNHALCQGKMLCEKRDCLGGHRRSRFGGGPGTLTCQPATHLPTQFLDRCFLDEHSIFADFADYPPPQSCRGQMVFHSTITSCHIRLLWSGLRAGLNGCCLRAISSSADRVINRFGYQPLLGLLLCDRGRAGIGICLLS